MQTRHLGITRYITGADKVVLHPPLLDHLMGGPSRLEHSAGPAGPLGAGGGVGQFASSSAEKLVQFVRIYIHDPGLRQLAILEVADVAVLAMLDGLTRALCTYPSEYDRMFLGGEHIVHFNLERAVSQLKQLAEQAKHRVRPTVITRSLVPASLVPDDVRGEQLIPQRIHVTS